MLLWSLSLSWIGASERVEEINALLKTTDLVWLEKDASIHDLPIDEAFWVDFDLLGGQTFCYLVEGLSHLSQVRCALNLLPTHLIGLSLGQIYSLANIS